MKNTNQKFRTTFKLSIIFLALSLNQACSQEKSIQPVSAQLVNKDTRSGSSAVQMTNEEPYVILISADGFRYDYRQKYNATNLTGLAAQGVTATHMIPSYPSNTHPNHYSIITGLYPGHTGVVGNSFYHKAVNKGTIVPYDPAQKYWFNSKDIFTTANEQQMITGNINWPQGKTITTGLDRVINFAGTSNPTTDQKIEIIRNWLNKPASARPHLIALYFGDADHSGHATGTESAETEQAVKDIDIAIGRIVAAVKETGLPVNFVFVSDHGMINNETTPAMNVRTDIDTTKFVVNNQNSLVNLYAKYTTTSAEITSEFNKIKAKELNNYKVYMNAQFPTGLHYGGADDRYKRAGDIIIVPVPNKSCKLRPGVGMHGFDPKAVKEMGATFIAWGPAFKQGVTIPAFENVEIYGLLTNLLGLQAAQGDGKNILSSQVLR